MPETYEIISVAELENLPEDDSQAFIEAEAICRRNVARIEAARGSSAADETKLQYMTTISTLASQFGVPNLDYPADTSPVSRAYAAFARTAQAEVAKLVTRSRRRKDGLSVQLASKTRARIEQELENLRRAVRASDLPEIAEEQPLRKTGRICC